MNSGEKFTVPQGKEFPFPGPWIPVTPHKPNPTRSTPISVNEQGIQFGRGNWQELDGFPSRYGQQLLNYNEMAQNFNPFEQMVQSGGGYIGSTNLTGNNHMFSNIAGSYTQMLQNENMGCSNNTLANHLATRNVTDFALANDNASTSRANSEPDLVLQSQVDNWEDSSFYNLLFADQSQQSASLQFLRNNDNFCQLPQYGSAIPYNRTDNLNPPRWKEVGAASRIITSFESSSTTKTKKTEDKQLHRYPVSASDESLIIEREKHKNEVAANGNKVSLQSSELLQNIVNSSCDVISSPKENKSSRRESDEGIDLNNTPHQKQPKRRRHRPKVIVEGKPKRTPKSATTISIDSKGNPSGKRKYVRRKGLSELATELADSMKESGPNAETLAKRSYIRKKNLKDLTTELDSTKEHSPSAGTTISQPCTQKRNQEESKTQQADCTSSSDTSPGKAGKMKYKQKNGPEALETPQVDYMKETENDPNATSSQRSCRRVLNFDLENAGNQHQADKLKEMPQESKSSESQAMELQNGGNSGFKIKQSIQMATKNQPQIESRHTPSLKRMTPNDCRTMLQTQAAAATQFQQKDLQTGDLNVAVSNVNLSQNIYRDEYNLTQQNIHPTQISQFSQGANYQEYIDGPEKIHFERFHQSVPTVLSNPNEGRGSKRGNSDAIQQEQFYASSSMTSLFSDGLFQMKEGYINGSNCWDAYLQDLKRKKIDESHAYTYAMKYGMPYVSGKLQTRGTNNISAKEFTSLSICGTSDPRFQSDNTTRIKNSEVRELTHRCVHSTAAAQISKQQTSFQQHSGILRNINGLNLVRKLPTIENSRHHLPTTPEKAAIPQFGSITKIFNNNVSEKKTRETGLSRRGPSGRGKMLQEQKEQYQYQHQQSSKARGPSAKQGYLSPIDEMTNKFMALSLNEIDKKAKTEAQSALVIYKGAGTLVPHEGLDFIKRRKPRPKVDLDPETNRIWNLLMGKDRENIKGTDKEKEKWWEEERAVFSGRVDSFIARMNLVQGKRKFSKWKGSVVDSVIGVFLTQNVSDHLSSSAFMSLAARFPLKSSCKSECNRNGEKILIEEPDACEPKSKETIKWQEFDSQSSITLNASTGYPRTREISGIERNSFTETHSQSLEEEVLSSQGSFDSSVIQTIGGNRSYSGSNSETEDPTAGCQYNNMHGSIVEQMENIASCEELNNYLSTSSPFQERLKYRQLEVTERGQKLSFEGENHKGSSSFTNASHFRNQQVQVQAVDVSHNPLHMTFELEGESLELCGEECMSSLASNASGFNMLKQPGICEGNIMFQQNGQAISQNTATAALNTSSAREHIMHQNEDSQQGSSIKINRLCNYHKEKMNKAFKSESISVPVPRSTDAVTIMQKITSSYDANALKLKDRPPDVERMSSLNKDRDIESRDVQYNTTEQIDFSKKEHGENSILKPKRRKAEEGKTDATDWDALRKDALANGWNSERSEDCMDSLDYEAMKNADVNDISTTIKERGMNNMLAQRIKGFLNRMVEEHKNIDLEWLKYVPPDKAKDFLLSIRGLGLKSVECVRLLTLHHVAFPVDTNVGRIAVRLGWVPLQPLPETLQLHLLEMYPILESVQKYLWPRLCKLDQPTLYELHYQMITFGKVFCTKSKPNCNACPMRAECRHFASAFASARLALPGPEERSITSSTVPRTFEERSVKNVSLMPLPTPGSNFVNLGPKNGNYEPIIEEPATPEPEHTEDSCSDIEDAVNEDSEEIPTINLNIEEFTATLQNYMQAEMEVQEGDLSKALVALNPQAASVPTQKLKNVSRLRTEHYVYELPDNHSILKGMERRQPDDPCPYLLAIWSPGETATSIQPPEQSCGSQELGTLCSDNTCFACNSFREANAQTVRGTLLVPCRTAMRGSFPLNGTYFQVNEVFAEHESSINPMQVPREWIWNLPRRTVYFGTSVSSIFKGLSTEEIQYCFWRGFVCVRGFDPKTRVPRPLIARLHFPVSKLAKTRTEDRR